MKEAQNISTEGERVIFSSFTPHQLQFSHSLGKHVVCSPFHAPIIYIYGVFYLLTDLKHSNNGYNRVY